MKWTTFALLLALLLPLPAYTQTYVLSPVAHQQFFDASGVPLSTGFICTYAAGTTTPLVTYKDSTGTTNQNPVLLDSGGFADIWLPIGVFYKFVAFKSGTCSSGVQQWSVDNISASSGGGGGGGGLTPSGTSNDVQIYGTPTALKSDTTIFWEDPIAHIMNLGTPTIGGSIQTQGPNAGEHDFKAGTAGAFPGAGYSGIAAPTSAAGLRLFLPGAPCTDGQFYKQASHSGSFDATIGCATITIGTPVFKSEPTSYQVLAGDFSTPSPACGVIAVGGTPGGGNTITLVDTATQPAVGLCLDVLNYSTQGIVTVARSGQLINGTTQNTILPAGHGLHVVSDGTNYIAQEFVALSLNNNAIIGGQAGVGIRSIELGFVGTASRTTPGADYNIDIGYLSGASNVAGYGNVMIGGPACQAANVDRVTCIGFQVGQSLNTGSSDILIGRNVDVPASGTSNYLNIGEFLIGDIAKGILIWEGPTTVLTCGTSPTLKTGSNDTSGEVTVGTSSSNSCIVTFANAHTAAPNCIVSNQTKTVVGFGYSISTTALTITATSALDSSKFDYFCPGASTATHPTP